MYPDGGDVECIAHLAIIVSKTQIADLSIHCGLDEPPRDARYVPKVKPLVDSRCGLGFASDANDEI